MKTRIAIIGGFLGSGKTTLITNMANSLMKSGRKIAIIMNDQGTDLVDSQYSCNHGLDTCDVQGGCFCCRFPDFMHDARGLIKKADPDIIFAEPVGSCTDLLATVIGPLKVVYADAFTVAPLMIVLDASRALSEGLSPDSLRGYLRHHQIEEAEYVVLSKVDLVQKMDIRKVTAAIREVNKEAKVIPYSSVTGEGFERVVAIVDSKRTSDRSPKDIDYDTYAKAEAELGWYNGRVELKSSTKFDAYDLITRILRRISSEFSSVEIAHTKLMLVSDTNAVKMSQVGPTISVDGVKGSRNAEGDVTIYVNARIVSSPDKLRDSVRRAVKDVLMDMGLSPKVFKDDCFSPSAPKPYYRITKKEEG
ncbi:MAG: CobW-like GTP-binding protein [Methanomassiliicoccales archaeon]|nr:CobW-like GTP-binding protein [Methanomassiliicoccales archaeon]